MFKNKLNRGKSLITEMLRAAQRKISAMKAFQVWINGEEKCITGVGEFGNMHAVISYISMNPADLANLAALPAVPENIPAEMMNVAVTGVMSSMNGPQIHEAAWIGQTLAVGDGVEFRIVEVDAASAPMSEDVRERVDPKEKSKASRREMYERLKREFE